MAQGSGEDADISPRDLAARAAWMSFVGGQTQDQIAQALGISRQRAQRLVARASAEGLIRVRINHPIAECLELESQLKERFDLHSAWVSPSLGGTGGAATKGLASFAAPVLERLLRSDKPQTVAVGTGRTLRMVVEQMQSVDGSHHRLVALNGNLAPDGSATAFEVIVRLAEKFSAPQYPLAIPAVARSEAEYEQYTGLPHVAATRSLAELADMAIVGIGQMTDDAPMFVDGFISADELADLQAAGAAGEIVGYVFDRRGRYLDHRVNALNMGVRVPVQGNPVCCIGAGSAKVAALHAALSGGLIDHLVTDEETAKSLINK